MTRSVIVSAVRTPFGRLGGGLAKLPATELGAIAIRAGLERAGVDPAEVGYVVMGQVLQAGVGPGACPPGGDRGRDPEGGAGRHDQQGVRLVDPGDRARRPDDPRRPARRRRDGRDGVDVERAVPAAEGALRLPARERRGARPHGLRRAHLDVRRRPHGRAGFARRPRARHLPRGAGRLGGTIAGARRCRARMPAGSPRRSSPSGDLEQDEGIRRDTTLEKLAALKPVFDPEGTTTAGNAPGVNDGASCVVVCSEEFARSRGLDVLATIVGYGAVADDFAYLARTPANAGALALAEAGRTTSDVARVEINEAFASVASNSTRMLGVDEEIVNVNGGAIALGHPIGASGGRIVGTLVHELRRVGWRSGPGRDLLGRRPGRRPPDRGLT